MLWRGKFNIFIIVVVLVDVNDIIWRFIYEKSLIIFIDEFYVWDFWFFRVVIGEVIFVGVIFLILDCYCIFIICNGNMVFELMKWYFGWLCIIVDDIDLVVLFVGFCLCFLGLCFFKNSFIVRLMLELFIVFVIVGFFGFSEFYLWFLEIFCWLV